jgi:hypothetical protein
MRLFNRLYQTYSVKVISRPKANGHKRLAQGPLADHAKVFKKPKWQETCWNSKAGLPQGCVKRALKAQRNGHKQHTKPNRAEVSKRHSLRVHLAHKAHKLELKQHKRQAL